MSSARFVALFAIACAILSIGHCEMEVKLLHVLFRHGDKVPHKEYQNYPNDPHLNHSYYPIGNGGLTNEGKRREYKIGEQLRKRYNNFLGSEYLPDVVYAQSTEYPRTQMSLQLVLAGLYPPAPSQNWNPRLHWQPVVTSFTPIDEDYLLFPQSCPRYVQEYKRFLLDDDVQDILRKYQSVMKYLTDKTGKVVNTSAAVYYLYNLLKEQESQNLSLPKWSTEVFPSPMKEITALDFNLRSYTKTLKRLNGGILLRKITDDIKDLREGNLSPRDRKVFLFSAHELNVAALVRVLGTDYPVLPAYGSTVIIETLQDTNKIYYIRVLLWTGVTENLITQQIPGCSEICPLDEFLQLMEDVIPNDTEYPCYENKAHVVLQKAAPLQSGADHVAQSKWQMGVIFITILLNLIHLRILTSGH